MDASQVMTEDPATIEAKATLLEAVEVLQMLEVRHLPVVGPGGELVGMISDRDVRAATAEQKVGSVMSANVVSVRPDSDVDEIIDLMIENRIGAVPVVDGSTNEVLGIVSYVDLLRAFRGLA